MLQSCAGLATADARVPLACIEKHPWMWFCMSCKTGPHPTSAFKRRCSKIFRSTDYSTHAGHGKIQVFTKLGWPPCVRISEMVAFLGTNFMSDIQSWDYTHADTSVLFLTPPPPTVPNPDQSHPCQECGIHGVRSRTYSFCCIKCRFTTRIRRGESTHSVASNAENFQVRNSITRRIRKNLKSQAVEQ
jgi:hypothetical protein